MAMRNSVRALVALRPWGKVHAAHSAVPLSETMVRQIVGQNPGWKSEVLSQCSYTTSSATTFMDCKHEIEIFEPGGTLIIRGRDFRAGPTVYWSV